MDGDLVSAGTPREHTKAWWAQKRPAEREEGQASKLGYEKKELRPKAQINRLPVCAVQGLGLGRQLHWLRSVYLHNTEESSSVGLWITGSAEDSSVHFQWLLTGSTAPGSSYNFRPNFKIIKQYLLLKIKKKLCEEKNQRLLNHYF